LPYHSLWPREGPLGDDSVVINELYPDPEVDINGDGEADQKDEFIELFNGGEQAVQLEGWSIHDNTGGHILSNVTISPKGYHLVGREVSGLVLGRDDGVQLRDPNGTPRDEMYYTSASRGDSFIRSPDGSKRIRRVNRPTPNGSNPPPSSVLINEVMVDPEGANTGSQWVELYNQGEETSSGGFTLTNHEGLCEELEDVTIERGERILVAFGDGLSLPDHPGGTQVICLDTTDTLYVIGDDLQLNDADGYLMDYTAWGASTHNDPPDGTCSSDPWNGTFWDEGNSTFVSLGSPNPEIIGGFSLQRKADGHDIDSPLDWGSPPGKLHDTCGWDNSLDPSFEVTGMPSKIEMDPCSEFDVPLRLIRTGSHTGRISTVVSQVPPGWNVRSPLDPTSLDGDTNISIGVSSPGNRSFLERGELVIHFVWTDLDFYTVTERSMLLVPGFDCYISDPYLIYEGKEAGQVPRGALLDLGFYLACDGETGAERVFASLVYQIGNGSSTVTAREWNFSDLTPSSRRTVKCELDTLDLPNNTVVSILLDPEGEVEELDENNNIRSWPLHLFHPVPFPGQSSVLIERIMWNCSEGYQYMVLENPADRQVDISRMVVTDGVEIARFPEGALLGPGMRAAVLWSERSSVRIGPTVNVSYYMEGGPSRSRMVLKGAVPSPTDTGTVVVSTEFRVPVDSVVLWGPSSLPGFELVGRCLETTWDTEMIRKRGPQGPFDTNTSLDWEVHRKEVWVSSILPAPGPGGPGEMIVLSSPSPGLDISGYVLCCGTTHATIPNGTLTDPGGNAVLSSLPERYRARYGAGCLLDTGHGVTLDDGTNVKGCRVPGYPELVLPDAGGVLELRDPGGAQAGSFGWGAGTQVGEVDGPFVLAVHEKDGKEWYSPSAECLFPSPIPSLVPIVEDISASRLFFDLSSGLDWLGEEGGKINLLMDSLEAGIGEIWGPSPDDVDLYLTEPPWFVVPEHSGGIVRTNFRIMNAKAAVDIGHRVHVPLDVPDEHNGLIGWSEGRVLVPLVVGPQSASMGQTPLMIGISSDRLDGRYIDELIHLDPSNWYDATDTIKAISPESSPGRREDAKSAGGHLEVALNRLTAVGPYRPSPILSGQSMDIMISGGSWDLASLLDALEAGAAIRLIVSYECLMPGRMGEPARELLEGPLRHCHGPTSMDIDPLTFLLSLKYGAEAAGSSLEVRYMYGAFGSNTPGLIIGDSGMQVILGSDVGPMHRMALLLEGEVPDVVREAFDELWDGSLRMPWHMIGGELSGENGVDPSPVRIAEVYYDTYLPYDPDEFVSLVNTGSEPVNIRGYTLSDDECLNMRGDGTVLITSERVLSGGEVVYIARDGGRFEEQNGFSPDISWCNSTYPYDALLASGDLMLANDNDTLCLRDPSGRIVDVVPYGDARWEPGDWASLPGGSWSGVSASDVGWGRILHRAVSSSGEFADTDTYLDWVPARPRYPGQSHLGQAEQFIPVSARAGVCPENGSSLLRDIVEGSREEVLINVYEITSDWIVDMLIGARSRGVDVKLLLEGGPVGGISLKEKECVRDLVEGGVEVGLMYNDPQAGVRDRYRFDHAKYIVADRKRVLVSSENFKDTSFPGGPSGYSSGTRGWVVSIDSEDSASFMRDVFLEDFNGVDIADAADWIEEVGFDQGIITLPRRDPEPLAGGGVPPLHYDIEGAWFLFSPDHIPLPGNELLERIRSAQHEVLVELLDLDLDWEVSGVSGPAPMNPYVEALFDAAARGVEVRVLLDGSDFDGDGTPENHAATSDLADLIAQKGLEGRIEVRLHPSPRYIYGGEIGLVHNKGVLIDRRTAWVSSFNWGPTSGTENRELGVLLDSRGITGMYRNAFMEDWGSTLQDELTVLERGSYVDRNGAVLTAHVHLYVEWEGEGDLHMCLFSPSARGSGLSSAGVDLRGGFRGNLIMERTYAEGEPPNVLVVRCSDGDRETSLLWLDIGSLDAIEPVQKNEALSFGAGAAIAGLVSVIIMISALRDLVGRVKAPKGTEKEE